MDSKFFSRKWTLCLLVVVIATYLCIYKHIGGNEFVELVKWVVGLYMVGNVGSIVADKLTITSKVSSEDKKT